MVPRLKATTVRFRIVLLYTHDWRADQLTSVGPKLNSVKAPLTLCGTTTSPDRPTTSYTQLRVQTMGPIRDTLTFAFAENDAACVVLP